MVVQRVHSPISRRSTLGLHEINCKLMKTSRETTSYKHKPVSASGSDETLNRDWTTAETGYTTATCCCCCCCCCCCYCYLHLTSCYFELASVTTLTTRSPGCTLARDEHRVIDWLSLFFVYRETRRFRYGGGGGLRGLLSGRMPLLFP